MATPMTKTDFDNAIEEINETAAKKILELERVDKVVQAAVLAEREACAKLCEEREEYSMQIPCPDGIVGCCVFHSVRGSKLKDGRECAKAIRARGEK